MKKLDINDFKEIFDILKDSVKEKPYFREYVYDEKCVGISQIVYEDDKFNHFSEEDWEKYEREFEEETGMEYCGETLDKRYQAVLTVSITKYNGESYMGLNCIEVGTKHSGYGSRILTWLEEYAKKKHFKGVIIRYTESKEMNLLALKKGYRPILTDGDEYLLFNKENNIRLKGDWKYDENNNVFGYYLKEV